MYLKAILIIAEQSWMVSYIKYESSLKYCFDLPFTKSGEGRVYSPENKLSAGFCGELPGLEVKHPEQVMPQASWTRLVGKPDHTFSSSEVCGLSETQMCLETSAARALG